MSWKEVTLMSVRSEFVALANNECANISELCRRFGISRKTGYKWLSRFNESGIDGLNDKSKRPLSSPCKTPVEIENRVLELHTDHKAWGGRKLRGRLLDLGHTQVPSGSTITEILRRNDKIDPDESGKHSPLQRFECDEPNELWQMDFKGPVTTDAGLAHPLTILDDHSRYSLVLSVCLNQQTQTVKDRLSRAFEKYGLPWSILCDNGNPWGGSGEHSKLEVWLMMLGVHVYHGRPYHPQTQGKEERFHRTLVAEVLKNNRFRDQDHLQSKFDEWQEIYNYQRPHESLNMKVPASRYNISSIRYPSVLAPIEYGPDDIVRKVYDDGCFSFRGNLYKVGKAFYGHPVAIRATQVDGVFDVVFCSKKVKTIDLHNKK